jgi:hypothetical protein
MNTRPKSAHRLVAEPMVHMVERLFPEATSDGTVMEMAGHSAADLLMVTLNLGPEVYTSDGMRAVASELEYVIDSLIDGTGGDFSDEITTDTLTSMVHRLRVLAELDSRVRRNQDVRIRELEAEVAALKAGAT